LFRFRARVKVGIRVRVSPEIVELAHRLDHIGREVRVRVRVS